MKSGYVYVLTNESIHFPEDPTVPLVKIGATVNVEDRLGSLNSAVPVDFKIEMQVVTDDIYGLESYIHNELEKKNLRCGNSEYFKMGVKEAKRKVRELALRYHRDNRLKRPKFEIKIAQLGRAGSTVRNMLKRLYGDGDDRLEFRCTVKGTDAIGYFRGKDVFVVKEGSRICIAPAPAFSHSEPRGYYQRWVGLVSTGLENGRLKENQEFRSRAEAASVVCAGTKNGNNEWIEITKDGSKGRPLGKFFGR